MQIWRDGLSHVLMSSKITMSQHQPPQVAGQLPYFQKLPCQFPWATLVTTGEHVKARVEQSMDRMNNLWG